MNLKFIKPLLLSLLFFGKNESAVGQDKKAIITFTYFTHDFGNIKEDGGNLTYEFEFSNTGFSNLIIKKVQESCGCTVPEWPKEPILPSNSGKIKVVFNPMNKPGPFNKSLVVYSNATNESVILNVTGKVTPKPRKPTDDFPDALGDIRLISRYLNMGEMKTDKLFSKDFYVYNQSDTILSIKTGANTPSFVKINFESNQIPPNSKTKITITYDPLKKNDLGYVSDKIELLTSEKANPKKSLFITGMIHMYFPILSEEEKLNQPKFSIDNTSFDFGSIKQGDVATTTFIIKNNGKKDLTLFKVKPSCGCTVFTLENKTISAGQSSKLTITFDTKGKEGVQEKQINLYTNDPTNENPVITIKAKIQKNSN